MKTLEIKIKSREQADDDFVAAFKGGEAGKPAPRGPDVYFTSLEAVRTHLTDKRLALLELVRRHAPRSISRLAQIAGRDFKNVYTDVMLLKDYGLIQLGGRGKAARRPLSAPYQAINIHASLTGPHGASMIAESARPSYRVRRRGRKSSAKPGAG